MDDLSTLIPFSFLLFLDHKSKNNAKSIAKAQLKNTLPFTLGNNSQTKINLSAFGMGMNLYIDLHPYLKQYWKKYTASGIWKM